MGRKANSISGLSQAEGLAQSPGSLPGARCSLSVKISQLSDEVALGPTRGARVLRLDSCPRQGAVHSDSPFPSWKS